MAGWALGGYCDHDSRGEAEPVMSKRLMPLCMVSSHETLMRFL